MRNLKNYYDNFLCVFLFFNAILLFIESLFNEKLIIKRSFFANRRNILYYYFIKKRFIINEI